MLNDGEGLAFYLLFFLMRQLYWLLYSCSLKILKNIKIYNPEANTGLLTFNIKGVYGSDAGKWFNANGIAVRTGQHCTRLLIDEFQTDSTIRVSLYFYNTFEEIDKFIEVCRRATRDNIYNLIFNNSKENKNV